jgi:predicted ATP-grasp superfamily ATP-dependent carboligase
VTLLAAAFGLKGLGSADFLLAENQPLLIEINPRPGATLDIFACAKKPLLKLHIGAMLNGTLPRKPLVFEGAAAASIVHAPKGVIVPRSMIWPSWAADLPKPGERIDKQRPICTVLARAGTEARAKRLAETRKASLLAKIQELSKGDKCERHGERRRRNASDETAERQRAGRAAHRRDHR